MTPVPLYEMYGFLKNHRRLVRDYSQARVLSAEDNGNGGWKTRDIALSLPKQVPPYEIAVMEELIENKCGYNAVNINVKIKPSQPNEINAGTGKEAAAPAVEHAPVFAAAASGIPAEVKTKTAKSPPPRKENAVKKSSVILGKATKTMPKPMKDVTLDDGRVTIRGFVCAVRSRLIERRNAYLLTFDITDYTNTINVTRFMEEKNAKKVVESIKKGMYLTVTGTLSISRYDQELTLYPLNIFISEYAERADDSEPGKKRVELHLHTKMSATDGLTDVSEVISRAAAWGHPAIAITDHGVVHSFPEAAIAAKAAAKKGNKIKVIYGIEGYFLDGDPKQSGGDASRLPSAETPGSDIQVNTRKFPDSSAAAPEQTSDTAASGIKKRFYHIILLAKNKTGLKNLYKLVTKSHIKHFYRRPLIYRSVLEKHRDGLIIGSACESGELFRAVAAGKSNDELLKIASFYDYLEIQPVCNNMFMILRDKEPASGVEDLRGYNRKIVELGKVMGKPVAATTDAHFLDPSDEIFRRIILHGKGFESAAEELPLYFRTTREMLEEFNYLGEDTAFEVVVENPNKIADMCEEIGPLPPDKQFFPPTLEGSAQELKDRVYGKIPELYGDDPPRLIIDRVEAEMKDILGLHYDVIYMTAQKLVAFLMADGNRVGSRGSVGSSYVAYLAGITEVNPLPAHYRCPKCKHTQFEESCACGADMPDKECNVCGTMYLKEGFNIPFETFLGFNGEKIPDIDLNIPGDPNVQSKAQKFIYDLFGSKKVFRAGTIGTIAEKNAYRMVRNYLEAVGQHVTKAEENRLISGCHGVKQTTGQHPGGLIVIPHDKEITDFCPVQHPADDKDKGVITTHFDYHKMEDHLIKLDMLGHDNPLMIVMLEKLTGVNADTIRLDDPGTISIFSSPEALGLPLDDKIIGETGAIGIPEFGTPFVRQMLCDTKPKNFDTLVRLSGYSHGEKVWLGNAKELLASKQATVAETISSRDDIMLYLISKGMDAKDAFKVSESVRKGRGVPAGSEDIMHSAGVPQWYIDSCKKIGYLFPKAHAVAYVLMAFKIAWFKVHRPLEYYMAHFYRRSQNNAFDASAMTGGIGKVKARIREMEEIKDATKKDEEMLVTLESCYEFYLRGFSFAPIDIYESDAEKFLKVEGPDGKMLLRPPFVAINGLGAAAANALAGNRKNREFISMEEISSACPGVNKNHIEELARLGALRGLPESNQMSLF